MWPVTVDTNGHQNRPGYMYFHHTVLVNLQIISRMKLWQKRFCCIIILLTVLKPGFLCIVFFRLHVTPAKTVVNFCRKCWRLGSFVSIAAFSDTFACIENQSCDWLCFPFTPRALHLHEESSQVRKPESSLHRQTAVQTPHRLVKVGIWVAFVSAFVFGSFR